MYAQCGLKLLGFADQQQLLEEHQSRTEQLILDTSKREAELLLTNSELSQEVRLPWKLGISALS